MDTNVLGRLANLTDAQHGVASQAVVELHRRGEVLHVTPQVLVEFRNVATRPIALNGLGLSTVDAEAQAAGFEAAFLLLAETPDIYPAWKALVGALGIIGKQVHDARLVAVCHVHAVTHLLTFNVSDFVRMAGFGPAVVVVDPATV
ncbi:MAG: type II toxin-antitoxin system VapC family toxin [Bradyrhizobium sp.]